MLSAPTVAEVSASGLDNSNTVSVPTIITQQSTTTAPIPLSVPIVPALQPTATPIPVTVSPSIVPTQQQPTTTSPIIQRPSIKVSQPESFNGEKIRLVGDWLAAVKRYLSLSGVEETRWVAYAVTMLTSTALSWWNSVELSNPSKSTLDYTWDEFVELMRERFVPADSEAVAMSKMTQWKQTGSVANYISQFQCFDQLVPSHRLDEEMRVQLFIQGLKPECRLIVNVWEPKTLQQVYKMALKFDNIQRQSLPKFNPISSTRVSRNRTVDQQEGTKNNPITIYNAELQREINKQCQKKRREDEELNQVGRRTVRCLFLL